MAVFIGKNCYSGKTDLTVTDLNYLGNNKGQDDGYEMWFLFLICLQNIDDIKMSAWSTVSFSVERSLNTFFKL